MRKVRVTTVLTLLPNTDVPSSRIDHDANCCDSNLSLSNKLLKIYRYVGDDLFFFHITLTVINVIEVRA
jgi:hypothetical protein